MSFIIVQLHYTIYSIYVGLRSKYDVIVQSLPCDYEKTLQAVQDHLTDDQICDVLTSPNYTVANKTILNCLIEKVKCTANIVEFSNQLEKIATLLPNSETLLSVVLELRAGKELYAFVLLKNIEKQIVLFIKAVD